MAVYHAMLGEAEAAGERLDSALSRAPEDPNTLFRGAQAQMQLAGAGAALPWLERALEAGLSPLEVRQHPLFEELLDDERFRQLMSRAEGGAAGGS